MKNIYKTVIFLLFFCTLIRINLAQFVVATSSSAASTATAGGVPSSVVAQVPQYDEYYNPYYGQYAQPGYNQNYNQFAGAGPWPQVVVINHQHQKQRPQQQQRPGQQPHQQQLQRRPPHPQHAQQHHPPHPQHPQQHHPPQPQQTQQHHPQQQQPHHPPHRQQQGTPQRQPIRPQPVSFRPLARPPAPFIPSQYFGPPPRPQPYGPEDPFRPYPYQPPMPNNNLQNYPTQEAVNPMQQQPPSPLEADNNSEPTNPNTGSQNPFNPILQPTNTPLFNAGNTNGNLIVGMMPSPLAPTYQPVPQFIPPTQSVSHEPPGLIVSMEHPNLNHLNQPLPNAQQPQYEPQPQPYAAQRSVERDIIFPNSPLYVHDASDAVEQQLTQQIEPRK